LLHGSWACLEHLMLILLKPGASPLG